MVEGLVVVLVMSVPMVPVAGGYGFVLRGFLIRPINECLTSAADAPEEIILRV